MALLRANRGGGEGDVIDSTNIFFMEYLFVDPGRELNGECGIVTETQITYYNMVHAR